jgi:Ankyrin repeats (many copies)
MYSKNITRTLFQREIGVHQNSYSYWKLRLEKDFGLTIEQQGTQSDCHLLYQNHYHYCEFLKSAIIRLESIRPQDIIQFLRDKNVGNGRVQKELLKLLLSKPGAYEACCYLDSFKASALSHAAVLPNKQCFILIKDKLLAENEPLLRQLLIKKDISGTKPIDYFRQGEPVKSFNKTGIRGGDDLFIFALNGDVDSLASTIDSLRDKAKEACLQSRDSYESSILHAAAESGSMDCLKLIMKTLGKDIEKLYYKDSRKMTPAYYAATYGSLELLRTIIQLSPISPEAELFDSNGTPSQLVDRVMTSNDIGKIQLILTILKQEKDKVELWYANHSDGISWILSDTNSSAANFFLLQECITFDRNCLFIKEFADRNNENIPFSLYCAVNNHLHELEMSQRKTI